MHLNYEQELGSLDFKDRFSWTPLKHTMVVLEQHPDWKEAKNFFSWLAKELVDSWCSQDTSYHGVSRNNEFESASSRALASYVLQRPRDEALLVCEPIVNVIPQYRREVSWFISHLTVSADLNTEDCFWDLWQQLANKIVDSTWGQQLTDDSLNDATLLNLIFLNYNWKKDVKHWYRLNGHAHLLDALALDLPPTVPVLLAYCRFLFVIGNDSLPSSFETVAHVLKNGKAVRLASHSDIALVLETLLRPFVYSHPHRIKSNASLREAVLMILDALVEGGSSSAYRMRDDFVTPSSQGKLLSYSRENLMNTKVFG